MAYKIIWDKIAYNFLTKIDKILARRIVKVVKDFSIDPRSRNVKRLKGTNAYRLRAGDYRIIIGIDSKDKVIRVLKIGHRKNIYD